MFSMSAKARAKLLARLIPLVPAGGAPPVTVVRGAANAAWTRGAIVVAALFGGLFVVALVAGVVIIPGGLAAVYFIRQVRPVLFLAPSPAGVYVSRPSFFMGRPTTIEATLPPVAYPPRDGKGTVTWGDRTVTLSAKEYRELVAATVGMGAGSFPTPPAPSTPPYLAPAPADTATW